MIRLSATERRLYSSSEETPNVLRKGELPTRTVSAIFRPSAINAAASGNAVSGKTWTRSSLIDAITVSSDRAAARQSPHVCDLSRVEALKRSAPST
jgi:hypothetical protein